MDLKFYSNKLCSKMRIVLLEHMHERNFSFLPICVEMSFNTKTRLQFLRLLSSTFIVQIERLFLMHALKKEDFIRVSLVLKMNLLEQNLQSISFKVALC